MATFRFDLTSDRRRLRFRINEKPEVDFKFDAASIDSLIARLGEERAQMQPNHGRTAKPRSEGADYVGTCNPGMAVSHLNGAVVLHVNDPRFGWLHFFLEGDRAARVAGYLNVEAARIAPPFVGASLRN